MTTNDQLARPIDALLSAMRAHFNDNIAIAVPTLLTLLVVLLSRSGKSLSFSDRWQAWWFLFNGTVIHIFLDGFVGLFGQIPYLADKYAQLDKRYSSHDPLVALVSLFEMFVMAPLCLALYYAIVRKTNYRHPLQICLCFIHLMGTYFFSGVEVASGFKHVPADFNFDFNFDHVVYFWLFFVAANILWIALPLYLAVQSMSACSNAFARVNGNKKST